MTWYRQSKMSTSIKKTSTGTADKACFPENPLPIVYITVSVATSCFTLVAISMERYFAIVHPLQSRSWQTLSHAYKIIAVCWLSALVSMSPIAVYTKRLTINAGRHACREMWPTKEGEMAYMVFMDLILLVLPVNIMAFSYGKVISTLWVDIKDNTENEEPPQHIARYRNGVVTNSIEMNAFRKSLDQTEKCGDMRETTAVVRGNNVQMYTEKRHMKMNTTPLRQTNLAKSRAAKLRVIKMLTAVVMEYFLCWTPLFFIQSWIIFDLPSAQNHISPLAVSLTHLFSYVSTCCNPVTYCFMNKKFRDAFLGVFQCCKGAINLRKSSMFRSGDWTSNQNSITRVTSMKNHAGGYERYQDSDEHSDAISR